MGINAGKLNQQISIMELISSDTSWAWSERRKAWADVEETASRRIFSTFGAAAENTLIFTIRHQQLSMNDAIEKNGQHCLLTSIVPTKDRAHLIVTAAPVLSVTASCKSTGKSFPCCLTEKYVGYKRDTAYSEVTAQYVLVLPNTVILEPGDLVTLPGYGVFNVQVPHELDLYKNEYEAERTGDA